MEKENKELLLKDLCARLPYGVKISIKSKYQNEMEVETLNGYHLFEKSYNLEDRNMKPYLRPMSSMTEEEKNFIRNKYFFEDWINWTDLLHYHYHQMNVEEIVEFMEWIYANHFDLPRKVDGKLMTLVDLGLALEAPEGMYN